MVPPLAIPDCGAVDVPAAEQRQPAAAEAALRRTARRGRAITFATQNIKGNYTSSNIRVLENSVGVRLQARAKESPPTVLLYPADTSSINGVAHA